ncbi:MAG: OsmC family protein [Planctomycetota bacterium]
MAGATTLTATLGESGFRTDISSGAHAFTADEPGALGGDDSGPSPYVLLLSALGACKAMTMRLYADRKGWDLTGATVELTHQKASPEEAGVEPSGSSGKPIDLIEVRITVDGDLDDDQKQRIIDIAERCPVHQTITNGTTVVRKA